MTVREFNKLLQTARYNENAFKKFYDFLMPKLKIYIRWKFGDRFDASEMAHEIIAKIAYKEIKTYVNSPMSWTYRVAANHLLTIIGKEKVTDPLTLDVPANNDFESVINNDILEKLLAQVDPVSREIVVKFFILGYHYKEIAKSMNLSDDAVRSRSSRAIKIMKNYATKHKDELS